MADIVKEWENDFEDKHLSRVLSCYCFDVIAFDEYLKLEHGYTEEHGSVRDFLIFKWGVRSGS